MRGVSSERVSRGCWKINSCADGGEDSVFYDGWMEVEVMGRVLLKLENVG